MWHGRLGNACSEFFSKIARMVQFIDTGCFRLPRAFTPCLQRKYTWISRSPSERTFSLVTNPLQLAYADIVGSRTNSSINSSSYLVTLCDDASAPSNVRSTDGNEDVGKNMKIIITEFEKAFGSNLMALRTENGV